MKMNNDRDMDILRSSGAMGKYSLNIIDKIKLPDDREIVVTRIGEKRYSPVMIGDADEIEDIAYDVADIIEKSDRKTITFKKILEDKRMHSYAPECSLGTGNEHLLDTESKSGQSGFLSEEKLNDTVRMKEICARCPFRKECLAVSMTTIQISRISKNSKNIPQSNPPLTMSEYLIFGGYTPQERDIIFDRVCEILSEFDELHDHSSSQDNSKSLI